MHALLLAGILAAPLGFAGLVMARNSYSYG